MTTDEALLSKLLFEAREAVEMYADIVAAEVKESEYLRRLVREIDAYRTERGWSPSGFGGEG